MRVTTASIHGLGKRNCACAGPVHILAYLLTGQFHKSSAVLLNVSRYQSPGPADRSAASESAIDAPAGGDRRWPGPDD